MEKKSNTFEIVYMGLMAAVICILGPLSIPIGVVPISFTNLAVYIVIYSLGMKKGSISYIIYMLLGFVGLPVFSNFSGGPSKLFGPTGGYIIGFFFMALIAGFFIDKYFDKWYFCILGMVLGTAVCYIFGSFWLAYEAHLSASKAFAVGVIPFIPGDLTKILIASILGPQIRQRLIKANLYKA
ncbi:biotin transporter BioY [Candidatus Clostridium radicumherbarum]|uniref:Biotin transporter n=1 Tax=Candidatus Clostridium radicumherbarum TaxID=3381662 RepID=A0ABW8TVU7_9CLOT